MPQVFYDMKARKKVSVPDSKIKAKKLSNGRWQLIATSDKGTKLFKFASEAIAKKYK